MTAPPIQPETQQGQLAALDLQGAALVDLFDLDLRAVLGWNGPYDVHFTSSSAPGAGAGALPSYEPIRRGNKSYMPVQIEALGFDRITDGAQPQPTLRVGNASGYLDQLAHQYDGGIGAIVTRWRVLSSFLDGQPGADPNAYSSRERYVVEQKTEHDTTHISWRLVNQLEQGDRKLPGRQAFRNVCHRRYRLADGAGGFDYAGATCPYTGANHFDYKNQPTTAQKDQCRKDLRACSLRFPATPRPTTAFPGLGGPR